MKFPELSPQRRSVLVAVVAGMMAAATLHGEGMVDLSFGFPQGGFAEGALMAFSGAAGGYAVLLVFRALRRMTKRQQE